MLESFWPLSNVNSGMTCTASWAAAGAATSQARTATTANRATRGLVMSASSCLSAERFGGFEDGLLRRHREVLEHGRERHRHVHGPDALDRRVEVIEGAVGDHRRDLGGGAVALVALVDHDGPRRLLGRIDQRLLVQGKGPARGDHLGAY